MFVFSLYRALYLFYVHDTPHACQAYLQMFRAWARECLAQGLHVGFLPVCMCEVVPLYFHMFLCYAFTCSFVCCCLFLATIAFKFACKALHWRRSKMPRLHTVKHQLPSQFLEKDPTEVNRQRVLFRSILTTIMILTAAASILLSIPTIAFGMACQAGSINYKKAQFLL